MADYGKALSLSRKYADDSGDSSRDAYLAWVRRALDNMQGKPSTQDAFFDTFELQPPPQDDEAHQYRPEPRHYVDRAPERVWPSAAYWDDLGLMPSTQERYGQAQSAALSALDALSFGTLKPALKRFTPETAASLNEVTKAHPNASIGASIAGSIANPMNGVFRSAGNALAARGHGIMSQAGADAATALGIGVLPDVVGGYPTTATHIAANNIAPTAFMSRVFMPRLPDQMVNRTVGGGLAGLTASLPDLAFKGDLGTPIINGIVGAVSGAGQRPALAHRGSARSHSEKNTIENAVGLAGIPAYMQTAGLASRIADDETPPPDADSAIMDWFIARTASEPRYPKRRPVFPHETAYEDLEYPRPMPRFD